MRESVSFIHAADLHLDAPFLGVSADNERVGAELAEATFEAWRRIVDLALERGVDFVVLAGDVYNSSDLSVRAQLHLRDQARRLADAHIGLLIAHGNHDPLSGRPGGFDLPGNVKVFGGEAVERVPAVVDGDFVVGVYGRSFRTSAEREDFTPGYRRDPRDTVAIGVLHANVGDRPDYDPYAPCTLDGLAAAGMDYWALGHIHKHEVLTRDPWAVYSGSPQGLNPKETGAHGCCVVTVGRGGGLDLEHVDLAPVAWAQIDVDAAGIDSLDGVESAVTAALERLLAEAGRPVVARVALTGRAPVHAELVRPGVVGQLLEALRAEHAARNRWAWLDRLEDNTSSELDIESIAQDPTFEGELVRLARELAEDPDALRGLVAELSGPLREKLPDYEPGSNHALVLERARDRVLDLLMPEGGAR